MFQRFRCAEEHNNITFPQLGVREGLTARDAIATNGINRDLLIRQLKLRERAPHGVCARRLRDSTKLFPQGMGLIEITRSLLGKNLSELAIAMTANTLHLTNDFG